MFMARFITNRDHAHLSGHMKNDARISITRAWGYNYALVADTHNAQFADKSNCKKPCNTCRPYIWASTCLVSVPCSFGLTFYLGTYKRIDHQNTGLVYKFFCSILQYTIKVKKLEVKINFEFKKGVGIAIKSIETSS